MIGVKINGQRRGALLDQVGKCEIYFSGNLGLVLDFCESLQKSRSFFGLFHLYY